MVDASESLKLGLPKGRMQEGVFALMAEAGMPVRVPSRGYRPRVPIEGCETKILKPQNIVEMLAAGTRDLGFAGADWVAELGADLVEIVDTRMDPVRLVAAAPRSILVDGELPKRRIVIASEYDRLTRAWIERAGLDAEFVRSYGATEVFPPEDADCIVDITQSGATLEANDLEIVEQIDLSSTRMYASRQAMENPAKREKIESVGVLLDAVLEARRRVMVELNVGESDLRAVVDCLPCMREPTVAPLHGDGGYAVRAAVPKDKLAALVPVIKAKGGTDIVVSPLSQIVP